MRYFMIIIAVLWWYMLLLLSRLYEFISEIYVEKFFSLAKRVIKAVLVVIPSSIINSP